MIHVPLKDIISKINQKSGLSDEDIRSKISEKVNQLYGLVSEEGAAHIIANEYGIKLFDFSGELKIKDILIGMRSVDVLGKVTRKFELREFSTEKRKGKVANLMIADETGSMRVVFWNDKTDDFTQIKEDDVIKIKNAYVRENTGRKELHMGDNSQLIINPVGVSVTISDRRDYERKHISELADGMSADILGTIVQVFDIRFFEVCPKCNKRLRLKEDGFYCDEHSKQEPNFNYVMSIFVDDGTSSIRASFWKQQTQKLLGIPDQEVRSFKDNISGFERYKTELLGRQVKLLGSVKTNMMGRLEFNSDLVYTNLDPEQELEMLDHAKEIALESKPSAPEKQKSDSGSDDEFEISEDFLE
jgi:ssDNA-binding replication factor A large subunit